MLRRPRRLAARPRRVLRGRAVAVALLALAACGPAGAGSDGGVDFGADPLSTFVTDGGKLHVELRSAPQPPVRGVNAFRYTVTNAAGAPVDGLTITVDPWMAAMSHGASVTPTVTAKGGGVYDISDVVCSMPGTWQLRSDFAGPVQDAATPTVEIP